MVRQQAIGRALRILGAVAIALSGYIHYRLYFDEGYRSIDLERVAGINLSRSFVLSIIVAAVVTVALLASLRWSALIVPACAGGIVYGIGAIIAYTLSRTDDLLGFSESRWITEAKIAKPAEAVAVVVLAGAVALRRRERPRNAGRVRAAARA